MDKRPLPVTACTNCKAPGYNITLAGNKCPRFFTHAGRGRKQYKGTIQSAIGEKDWGECPNCAATGYKDSTRCDQCEGAGWIFIH